jgi:phage terminase large subunit-like protein
MGEEDQRITKYYLQKETIKEQLRMEEEAKDTREREIEKMWKAMMTEDEEEKKRIIVQLMESAVIRGSKGKKKKRGGKKKKKK